MNYFCFISIIIIQYVSSSSMHNVSWYEIINLLNVGLLESFVCVCGGGGGGGVNECYRVGELWCQNPEE